MNEPLAYKMRSEKEINQSIAKINQSIGELEILNTIMQKFQQPSGAIYINPEAWLDFNNIYQQKAKLNK